MKKNSFFVFIILLLSGFLRFYRLGEIPVGFHRDEAFLGYNAYSILKTGRDMSGNFLPLHLESFIYSPAGYSYFSIPAIAISGLNEFAVRFASAVFGVLTVLAAYFLTKELLSNAKFQNPNAKSISKSKCQILQRVDFAALMAAGLLAVSPWHINLSRTATESTLVVFFISLGVWFYLRWLRCGGILRVLGSFGCFGATLLIYQAPRAFLPLFIPLLFVVFRPKGKKNLLLALSLYAAVVLMPLFLILASPRLSTRIRTLSIFAGKQTQLVIDEQLREDGVLKIKPLFARGFHNKLFGYGQDILNNYFEYFSYDFLFTDAGKPERYKVPGQGLLYLWELPLLFLGVAGIVKEAGAKQKTGLFLLGWVLLAPVGSALTFDDIPNLQRTLLIFPALTIIEAIGAGWILKKIKKKKMIRIAGMIGGVSMATAGLIFYLHQYYGHQVVHQPWHRQEGYKELASKVNELAPNYKKIVITDSGSAPTIFFLFYNQYDPVSFQNQIQDVKERSFDRIGFDKYEFFQGECPLKVQDVNNEGISDRLEKTEGEERVLYVNHGNCKVDQTAMNLLAEIKRRDGTTAFKIATITIK